MAIKISAIFIVLVATATLAQKGYNDYRNRVPSASLQLPSNMRSDIQHPYYNQAQELQNGFVPSAPYHQHYTSDVYKNKQTQQEFHYNNQGYNSIQSTFQNHNNNNFFNPSASTPNFGSGNLVQGQNAQQTIQANPMRMPVITKHIYFHLPPPDDTATAAPVKPPAPKKTYNIIFIKLPSQNSASAARLQQLVSQQAAADTKTLIYVLVKKSETHSIQPVTSKPEVFFVKYKEPRNFAQPVSRQASQVSTSGLLPGYINGQIDK